MQSSLRPVAPFRPKIRFVGDSSLEQRGFEPSVPTERENSFNAARSRTRGPLSKFAAPTVEASAQGCSFRMPSSC